MTKAEALYRFFSSFGLSAYEESSVPTGEDSPELPYLTYTLALDSFGTEIPLTANLWYRSTSWVEITGLAAFISSVLAGGRLIPCDGGAVLLRRGSPFAQAVADEDDTIRRMYLNITAEFITAD